MRIDVLGIGFDNMTMEEAVAAGMELLRGKTASYVVTPNPEIVEICRQDAEAREAVRGAALVLPDGIGVVKGAAILGTPLKGRVPGIEFAAALMSRMAAEGKSLFLLGAKPGVAEMAAEKLEQRYPGLRVVGTHDGYFTEDAPGVEKNQKQPGTRARYSDTSSLTMLGTGRVSTRSSPNSSRATSIAIAVQVPSLTVGR